MTGIDGRERAVAEMPEPRFQKWGRRVAIGLICFHAALWPWELYRRIWQVLRADITVSSDVLAPGATISIDVITSGEIRNRIVLELVQGARRETLLEFRGERNRSNVYDVRTYRYTPTVTLTSGVLANFTSGPAVVRLTGYGGQKLLRTPPPVVREQHVTLTAQPPIVHRYDFGRLIGETTPLARYAVTSLLIGRPRVHRGVMPIVLSAGT